MPISNDIKTNRLDKKINFGVSRTAKDSVVPPASETLSSPLFNPGDTVLIDADQLRKWEFPSVNIPANGYLIIFASGKNRSLENKRLHANFELSSSGESILLIKPDGETIADIIEFPQ